MIEFLEKFGYWVATIGLTLIGTMVWGRINDRFKRDEDRIEKLEAKVDKVEEENRKIVGNYVGRFDAMHKEMADMRLDMVNAINGLKDDLKTYLDDKYIRKDTCPFLHKGEQ
jgi:tetrahydromethanopterin S-methyltransferase subunit G